MSKTCAIVVAAGKGSRMKAGINKQFLNLKNKPILYYTLKNIAKNDNINEIILVLATDEIDYCRKNILDKYKINKVKTIVQGGDSRQQSVLNGLKAIDDEDTIVLIHDGARPFVSDDVIENGIKYAEDYGASACGVMPKDTIKLRYNDGFSKGVLDRESLFCVQTPQCFKYNIILESHENALKNNIQVTDDTMVVESFNHKVYLYEGSYTNIKITTPEDLIIGEKILDSI